MKNNISILILAAGASSRMQRVKQLLPWGNTTFLGNSITMAKATMANHSLVVLGANADHIARENCLLDVDYIVNPDWESGLGSSLSFGAAFVLENQPSCDGLLVMLCDQPLIDTEYLNALISQFKNDDKNIVATRYGERVGVPAIFSPKYFSALIELDKDVGAKGILEQYKNDVLGLDPEGKAVDVDTFEDYQRLINEDGPKDMP